MEKNLIKWEIFHRAVHQKLKDDEKAIFEHWLNSNEKNRRYYENALKSINKEHINDDELENKLLLKAKRSFAKYVQKKRNVSFNRWLRIAAMIALILSIPSTIYFVNFNQTQVQVAQIEEIKPGKSKAILTIENVGQFILDDKDTTISLDGAFAGIKIKSGAISYIGDNTKTDQVKRQKIEIPRGGEYFVYLPDSSKLFINSESIVKYNTPFDENKREIYVSGEAYVEVKKDSKRPFYVKTDEYTIRVLGTSFNICSYPNDNLVTTTLVTGSIEIGNIVNSPDKKITLKPDQQLLFNKSDSYTTVKKVDASMYAAWAKGTLVFEEETLSTIFSKLERWYDVDVEYLNESLKNELFTGKLPRFEDLQDILVIINKVSSSRTYIKDNTVYITNQ